MSNIGECPACENTDVSSEIEGMPPVCTDCGFVLSSGSDTEAPSVNMDETASGSDEPDWQDQLTITDSSDETLVQLIEQTEEISRELRVEQPVRTQAVEYGVESWISGFPHGRTLSGVAAATVDLACRQACRARPTKIVAGAAGIEASTVHDIRQHLKQVVDERTPVLQPVHFIPFLRKSLDIPSAMSEHIKKELDHSETLPSGNPAGVAGAAVYILLENRNDSPTCRDIGETVGLTKETIWKRVDEFREKQTLGFDTVCSKT